MENLSEIWRLPLNDNTIYNSTNTWLSNNEETLRLKKIIIVSSKNVFKHHVENILKRLSRKNSDFNRRRHENANFIMHISDVS